MKKMKLALAVSMLLTIVGCQSTPEENATASETNQASQDTGAPFKGVQKSHKYWVETLAEVSALNVYAPENYRELLNAWKEAGKIYAEIEKEPSLAGKSYSLFSSDTYAQAYDEQIKLVEQNYRALETLKQKADVILADSIAQMEYLDEIDAVSYYKADYDRLAVQYKKLFTYVVVDELEEAQAKQVEFLNNAKQLEIKVVKKIYILPLHQELKTLKKEDFNEVAPVSFATAENVVNIAANIAQTNPRDKTAIEQAVFNAKFEIEHVKQVTHQVKLLASVEDEKFENSVLEIENKLLAISKAVDGSDYRNVMLREQTEKILASVEKMHAADKTSDLADEVTALKRKVSELNAKNSEQQKAAEKASKREASLQAQIDREASHIKSLEELIANLKQQLALSQTIPAKNAADTPVQAETTEVAEGVDAAVAEAPVAETPVVETEAAVADEVVETTVAE
ncbi:DNA repair protein [Vibrio navarrensis]|uniref:DNA repair protein n=1 Tax=Vibrio navarrensis TaxID=29495 RepID=UPI00186A8390|nr:DNA repair protein [Vibrio navarrensis]